jgi:PAS domain S-box-containing protein
MEAWQASPLALVTLDTSGKVESANPASERILARKLEALQGMQLVEFAHKLDRGALQSMLDEARAGRTPGRQEIRFSSPLDEDQVAGFSVAPMIGGDGRVICVLRDLSKEKVYRPQLLHTERLASMGKIASIVAHELNNALAGAMGCVELASTDANSRTAELLLTTRKELQRASALVTDLKEYARVEDGMSDRIEVANTIHRSVQLHRFIYSDCELTTAVEDGLPRVHGNTNQLIQALLNLLRNAEDAVSALESEEPRAIHVAAVVKDDVVIIDVIDNGPGIARDARAMIFEPFYSEKAAGFGTGLGLTVVQTITSAHGGRVEILDTPGGGATVRLLLPYLEEVVATELASPVDRTMGSDLQGVRVLVADDELTIRDMLKRAFQFYGAEATTVGDAQAAIAAVTNSDFDLLLLDARMPGGGGVEAFRQVQALNPELARKTVFMSGELAFNMAEVVGKECAAIVQKPFLIEQLMNTLIDIIQAEICDD